MSNIKKVIPLALTALALTFMLPSNGWAQTKPTIQGQVLRALQDNDLASRLQTLAKLRDAHRQETSAVIITALDAPDSKTRRRAASFATALGHSPRLTAALLSHLRASPDAGVRLSCAIGLMRVQGSAVRAAYIHALKDPADKVAQIACMELGYRGGPSATAALFPTLSHPSWRVRLEVCKALITQKAADGRVVSTLEAMTHDPEAKKYDAEIDDFALLDKQMGNPPELRGSWGKIETILAQARHIAATRHKTTAE